MSATCHIPENDLRLEVELIPGGWARPLHRSPLGDAQIWKCLKCGSIRQWGVFSPPSCDQEPLLVCATCDHVTPHVFAGVISRWA